MKTQEIKSLVKIVEESDINELEVSRWGHKIRITKRSNHVADGSTQQIALPAQPAVQPAQPAQQSSATAPAQETHQSAGENGKADNHNFEEVKSPIVGTFYRSPSPESSVFVEIGDTVKPGQTLCIIEAMKIMNEIEAEVGGTLRDVLVENSQPVEYNQTLFLIEPN